MFRDYGSVWLGLGRGKIFNLAMTAAGLALFVWFVWHRRPVPRAPVPRRRATGWLRLALLLFLILYPLGIPTSRAKVNIEAKRQAAMQTAPDIAPDIAPEANGER